MRLGTIGDDSAIYIAVPLGPYSPYIPNLPLSHLYQFWDEVMPLISCYIRSSGNNFVVEATELQDFVADMFSAASSQGLGWFAGARFVHILRGPPAVASFETPPSMETLERHLKALGVKKKDLERDVKERGGSWFVDAGLKVEHPTKTLVWKTHWHSHLAHVLFGIDYDNTHYEKLPFSHLSKAAGGRVDLHSLNDAPQPGSIAFVDSPVTETEVRIMDECGAPIDSVNAIHVLLKPGNSRSFLSKLASLFERRSSKHSAIVNARVPLHKAHNVLSDVDTYARTFLHAIWVFDPADVW